MLGLYIHIPFCSGKCKYCDFVSFAGKSGLAQSYLDALGNEMSNYSGAAPDTLYIGGGTPTELDCAGLKRLLLLVQEHFIRVRDFSESTIEANPESLTRDKIVLLRQFGVSRISMGLQSFDPDMLARLGRRHTVERFRQAYADLRAVGFDNIGVDLIAGIPWQSRDGFAEGVKQLAALKPEHVSVYGLEIGEGSALAAEGVRTDEDLSLDDMKLARQLLLAAGYEHYEIANFALPGRQSRHNLNYWDNGEYIGLGCSASSCLGGVRKTNAPLLEHYCSCSDGEELALASCESLKGKAKLGESMMLGLRKLSGIALTGEMRREFGADLDELGRSGLLVLEGGRARLSPDGIYLSNEVFRHFVAPFETDDETADSQP